MCPIPCGQNKADAPCSTRSAALPQEPSVNKSLCDVEGRCKMDVSVFHSGAASLDGRSLRL